MIVLNFHGIGDVATARRTLEPGEAAYWIGADLFRSVLDLVAERRAKGQAIALTFDDGNRSDIEIGLPALLERALRATFFPLAGRLDTPGSLSADDLRALRAEGMGLGSHGYAHVDWRRLDEEGRGREFGTARRRLEAVTGEPVTEAAVPFGTYDRAVLSRLRRDGYARVYTSDGGAAGEGWIVARTSLRQDMSLADVAAVLDGRESPWRRLRRRVARLRKRLL